MMKYTRVLSIAGSDSGGGAGIQADLKTISACGCYGMTAITALTAQNTIGVSGIHPVPVSFIEAQIRAVFDDIGVDSVKIGMLHSREVIECVSSLLEEYGCEKVVLDPVMVATSGDPLIEQEAIAALKRSLFPVVQLMTPNIPEAELLLGIEISDDDELKQAATKLSATYATAVLLKAGHFFSDALEDILVANGNDGPKRYTNTRVETKNTHGTGCTLSSAIAAFWGSGLDLEQAIAAAENYLQKAIREGAGYSLGDGHGPVHHFYNFWA